MTQVTVVDYGAGNLLNVVRALEHCGAEVLVTATPEPIAHAQRLVLPGVGAFGDCMAALGERKLKGALLEYIHSGKLFLGICVGMQVMFDVGEEFGEHQGLGVIAGRVARIPAVDARGQAHKIPHIGWNTLLHPAGIASWAGTPLAPLEDAGSRMMYFVHSYRGVPEDASQALANVDYNGVPICAAVRKGNAYGVQFHPEKSGEAGLGILRNFLTLPV